MDIVIGDEKFVAKEKMSGADMIKAWPLEQREPFIKNLSLLGELLTEPRTREQLLALEWRVLLEFVKKMSDHFGLADRLAFLESK